MLNEYQAQDQNGHHGNLVNQHHRGDLPSDSGMAADGLPNDQSQNRKWYQRIGDTVDDRQLPTRMVKSSHNQLTLDPTHQISHPEIYSIDHNDGGNEYLSPAKRFHVACQHRILAKSPPPKLTQTLGSHRVKRDGQRPTPRDLKADHLCR